MPHGVVSDPVLLVLFSPVSCHACCVVVHIRRIVPFVDQPVTG
jgi:hypothetical protein